MKRSANENHLAIDAKLHECDVYSLADFNHRRSFKPLMHFGCDHILFCQAIKLDYRVLMTYFEFEMAIEASLSLK